MIVALAVSLPANSVIQEISSSWGSINSAFLFFPVDESFPNSSGPVDELNWSAGIDAGPEQLPHIRHGCGGSCSWFE